MRVEGRYRGEEEGRRRVPLGLCTGLVERQHGPLRDTPAQIAHQCSRQWAVGSWGGAQ
jgi:hypothetical protein